MICGVCVCETPSIDNDCSRVSVAKRTMDRFNGYARHRRQKQQQWFP